MTRKAGKSIRRLARPVTIRPTDTASADLVDLGTHPLPSHLFGEIFYSKDGHTTNAIPHRALSEQDGKRAIAAAGIREMLVQHHVSPQHRQAIERLGFATEQRRIKRFPTNSATQKCNLAEVVLAEYITASTGTRLLVYRLRYNPNIEQSMKGDDVLAFDLDANPMRLIVGEAKYRETSSSTVVKEIIDALIRSFKAGAPVSLPFIAEHLFDTNQVDIGERILQCEGLISQGQLKVDYMGLLMSDSNSARRVDSNTPATLRRLAMISLSVEDPDSLVDDCYSTLE